MQQSPICELRHAIEADMAGVTRIYGEHVAQGLASFDETPPGLEDMLARFRALKSQSFPYIVAERNNAIVGYAYAAPYRTRSAYRFTIENSVYVDRKAAGEGIWPRTFEPAHPGVREGSLAPDDRHHRQ